MADNVPVTAGVGTPIATDEIAGAHYQRVKTTFGVDGVATDVSASDPLPVSLASLPALAAGANVIGAVTQSGSWAVSGSGTFAVSAASLPLPTGAATAAKQAALGTAGAASADVLTVQGIASMTALKVDGSAVTQPVSGTVAATQSGTWNVGSITTLPALVAGTALIGKVGLDQTTPGTTNAVSLGQVGSTTVATGNGVVGTGVQRVSIASDNTAFSVNSTLQTGANVIGALTANQSVNVAQMNGVTVTMGSGVTGTGVQRVVLATDVALPTGANVIGALTANQSVNNAQIAGVATATGNGVVGTGVQRVAIASDNTAFSVNATGPTLTKGTQGSTGFSVQDLKDAGRTTLAMTGEFAFAQTAETLLTLTLSANGAATSTFSSRVVTNAKRLRITHIAIEVEALGSGTAPQRAYLRLRYNTAGAATTGTALQGVWSCVNNPAVVKTGTVQSFGIPDGLEFAGDGTAQFGFSLETPDWVNTTATGRAKITIIGFEY